MTRERVYERAKTNLEAKAIIVAGRGSHFDPAAVDAFLRRGREFEEIAMAFREMDAEQVSDCRYGDALPASIPTECRIRRDDVEVSRSGWSETALGFLRNHEFLRLRDWATSDS